MKKTISTILAAILIAALFQFPASAAGTNPCMNNWATTQVGFSAFKQAHAAQLASAPAVTVCLIDSGMDLDILKEYEHVNLLSSWNYVDSNSDVSPTSSEDTHGTATLSVLAGATAGIPINLVAMKVKDYGPISEANLVAALKTATTKFPGSIISMSISGVLPECQVGAEDKLCDAIRRAVKTNTVLVASGNEGLDDCRVCPTHSSAISGYISVGSTDRSGAMASFSNSAELLLPGVDIPVVVQHVNNQNVHSLREGTSYSCPLAAASAACLLARGPMSPAEVESALKSAVKDGVFSLNNLSASSGNNGGSDKDTPSNGGNTPSGGDTTGTNTACGLRISDLHVDQDGNRVRFSMTVSGFDPSQADLVRPGVFTSGSQAPDIVESSVSVNGDRMEFSMTIEKNETNTEYYLFATLGDCTIETARSSF